MEKEEDEEAEAQKEKDEGKVWMYACICGGKSGLSDVGLPFNKSASRHGKMGVVFMSSRSSCNHEAKWFADLYFLMASSVHTAGQKCSNMKAEFCMFNPLCLGSPTLLPYHATPGRLVVAG